MKILPMVFAVLTWMLAGICYYYMFYADAGPDGLGTFFPIIIVGILYLMSLVVFLIQLWLLKDLSSGLKVVCALVVVLPIVLILVKVFYVPDGSLTEVEIIEVLE